MGDDLPSQRLNIYLKAKQLVEQDIRQKQESAPPDSDFAIGQSVYYWEKSFGQTSWHGPVIITKVHPRKVQVEISPGKTRWFFNNRVALNPESSQDGEEATPVHSAGSDMDLMDLVQEQIRQLEQLQQLQRDKTRAIQAISRDLISWDPRKLINRPPNEARLINTVLPFDYLRDLAMKVYSSPREAFEVLTPQELQHWRELGPWEINRRLTGDPLSPPEWRTNLFEFDDEERHEEPEDPPMDLPESAPSIGEALSIPQSPGPITQPSEATGTQMPTKGAKSKGLKRGFLNLSKRIRTTASKLAHRPKDQNNNSGGQARFYVDLGPGGHRVATVSGSASSS